MFGAYPGMPAVTGIAVAVGAVVDASATTFGLSTEVEGITVVVVAACCGAVLSALGAVLTVTTEGVIDEVVVGVVAVVVVVVIVDVDVVVVVAVVGGAGGKVDGMNICANAE